MGDFNQFTWVENNRHLIKGPVLEIGSKFYDSTTSIDYRKICAGAAYTGVDLSEGENVDKVIDFTSDINSIRETLNGTFNTIICCSVMEHVKDIYAFAKNLSTVLNSDGVLFLSVPFTWEFHGYPNDFWRFTPAAIKFLFPTLDFSMSKITISSSQDRDVLTLLKDEDINRFLLKENVYLKFEEKNSGAFRLLKKLINVIRYPVYRKELIIRKMLGSEYRLSLSCINMIGVKL